MAETPTITVAFDEQMSTELTDFEARLDARLKEQAESFRLEREALAAELAEVRAAREAEAQRRAELEAEARRTRFAATAEGWYAAPSAVALMESLAGAFGEDSAELAAFVERERAHAAQGTTAKLFEVKGTDAPAAAGSDPIARFNATVARLTTERGLDKVAAFDAVLNDPEYKALAAEYVAAQRARG
jgi:hypothetical protein